MVRATGPGKVQSFPVSATDPTTELRASLFNYDIDGDTPKPEHERFLIDQVVPFLPIPGVKVALLGEASRTGRNAHNQDLSQRRVDKVRAFLTRHGMSAGQFAQQAVGESAAATAGQADGTEDEKFRAVLISVINVLGRRDPVIFSRARGSFINDGFDDTISPRWVMIPAEDPVRLMQVENAEGFSLVSTNVGVARPQPALFPQAGAVRITRQRQDFRIIGGVTGDAEIQAIDGRGRIRGRLQVSVLAQRTVKCAFHYVSNPRYGTRTRSRGAETDFLRLLNLIWDPQANIRFQQVPSNVGARPLVMNNRLGDEIQDPGTVSGEFLTVVRNRDRSAQFNVFFVREIERDAEGTRDRAGNPTDTVDASTGGGDCIFEDDISGSRPDTAGVAMAHEAGHCLTLPDMPPTALRDLLMFPTTAGGRFVPKTHVVQARRAVRP